MHVRYTGTAAASSASEWMFLPSQVVDAADVGDVDGIVVGVAAVDGPRVVAIDPEPPAEPDPPEPKSPEPGMLMSSLGKQKPVGISSPGPGSEPGPGVGPDPGVMPEPGSIGISSYDSQVQPVWLPQPDAFW